MSEILDRIAAEIEEYVQENVGKATAPLETELHGLRTSLSALTFDLTAEQALVASLRKRITELETELAEARKPPPPAPGPAFGIDVTTSQRDIDFTRAKADGAQFVIVKMGGLNVTPQYVAPYYRTQVDRARSAGLKVGHYYLVGKGQTPEQQADFFVKNLHNFQVGSDVLALDNEILNANGTLFTDAQAAAFLRRVIALTGIAPKRVWHYAGANDYRTRGPWTQVQALGVRIWWAAYGSDPISKIPDHTPDLQGSVADWHVHQFTSRAPIAGTYVDGNYSRLPVTELFG